MLKTLKLCAAVAAAALIAMPVSGADFPGKPIKLIMHSRDVIHNFFVRELRMKQDIVPGMEIPLSFQADIVGVYEVPCSELCGLGHFQMRTTMQVMSAADFEQWKIEKAQK